MKSICRWILGGVLGWVGVSGVWGQSSGGVSYTNFIRQVQLPSGVQWDVNVAQSGEQLSPLAINPGGARFELHTVKNNPVTSYLLDTRYVGTYVPIGNVVIRTEDPYGPIPRTRADRPFFVDVTVNGLLAGDESAPEAAKKVKLLRHVQSYGAAGTGMNLDRTQAQLLSQAFVEQNGKQTLSYAVTSVPGANRAKARGEERFSVFSLADYQAPESQLASQFVQIWPVADGSIAGISQGEVIRYALPTVTLTINDIYPESRIYAQVYRGEPRLGVEGTIVPGSALIVSDSVPQSRVLTVSNWDGTIPTDGRWTLELLTFTPFGVDRLAHLSFVVDRTLEVNGTVTTVD